jgi:hypothetical protein
MIVHRLHIVLLVLVSAACARITITKLPQEQDYKEGLRFYRPHPYLWVVKETRDGKEALENKIIWLPDLSQEYVVQVISGLGSVDFKPTIENGWMLTGFDVKSDSKLPELVGAISGLLGTDIKVFRVGEDSKIAKPGLYRFIFDRDRNSPNYGAVRTIEPIYFAE